jgi:hypothetical protein
VGISINDLRDARTGDATLRSLLGLLDTKLELCSRLPILEYEAAHEGHERCAVAFRRLAEAERRAVDELIECLREHIGEGVTARSGSTARFESQGGDAA